MEQKNENNNKKKCPKCGRILRKKNFIFNQLEKIEVCNRCNKKIGTNKWFIPKEIRNEERITRYGMSYQEKKFLNKNGHSWKELNGVCKYMRGIKSKKNKEYWNKIKMNKEKNKQETENKHKLIEGLK
jgi:hypothetical protein